MPTFTKHNEEVEVANPEASGDILEDIMNMYTEWDLFLDNVKAVLSFVQ